MPQVYNTVRGLSGAIMTGLGKISSYLAHNLHDDTSRLGYLSRRYPLADVDSVVQMLDWSLDAAAAGEVLSAVGSVDVPRPPGDYPSGSSRYYYHVRGDGLTASGRSAGQPFYTVLTSDSPMSLADIRDRLLAAAQDAAQKSQGKSPGAKALAANKTFDVSILSVWSE